MTDRHRDAVVAALLFGPFLLAPSLGLFQKVDTFGPTMKQNVFQYLEGVVPHVQIVMPGISFVVAIGMTLFAWRDSESVFWWKCAIIQAVPVFAITALHMWSLGWRRFVG